MKTRIFVKKGPILKVTDRDLLSEQVFMPELPGSAPCETESIRILTIPYPLHFLRLRTFLHKSASLALLDPLFILYRQSLYILKLLYIFINLSFWYGTCWPMRNNSF